MAARRPFWKWHRWKSIGFWLWPPSTCIWNLKFKFQSKLDLCSGNHVVYRQTDGRTDGQTDRRTRWIQYTPPPTSLGGGIMSVWIINHIHVKQYGHPIVNTERNGHGYLIVPKFQLICNSKKSPRMLICLFISFISQAFVISHCCGITAVLRPEDTLTKERALGYQLWVIRREIKTRS